MYSILIRFLINLRIKMFLHKGQGQPMELFWEMAALPLTFVGKLSLFRCPLLLSNYLFRG